MDGSIVFARLQECASHLIHAHPSSNPKQHLDQSAVFAPLTAERPYTLQWTALPPQNCLFPWGIWTHVVHNALGPSKPTTQTASQLVQPFLHSSLQSVPILYNRPSTPFHPQNCPFQWGSWPRLIHGYLGQLEFSTQRASRSVQPFLHSSVLWQIDRLTDKSLLSL